MKAQGLPMNTIVLGILSLLVLVLLAAAFVPSFRNFFTGTSKLQQQTAGEDDIQVFISSCKNWCSSLNGQYDEYIKDSDFCTRYITVETSPGNYMADHCYTETGDKIQVSCTIINNYGESRDLSCFCTGGATHTQIEAFISDCNNYCNNGDQTNFCDSTIDVCEGASLVTKHCSDYVSCGDITCP